MYGAVGVANWIQTFHPSTKDAVNNADSYNQFVHGQWHNLFSRSIHYLNLTTSAIYFKTRFGFLPPPASIVPITEKQECVGTKDQYVDSEILDKHRPDFCTQVNANYKSGSSGSFAQKYAEGTPSEVNFELSWSNSAIFSNDAVDQQCLDAIG